MAVPHAARHSLHAATWARETSETSLVAACAHAQIPAPVGALPTPCRAFLPSPAVPQLPPTSTAPARSTAPSACSFDIPGNDIPSNGRSYTQVCIPDRSDYKGKLGFDAWKAYCDDTPGCVAAVAPVSPNGCAYLKAKGTRDVVRPDPNWVVMTTQASGGGGNGGGGYGGGGYGGGGSSGGNSGSTGNPGCAKFVGNGEKCTTNPWAAEQICE
jgi:uncharacterized membrane protein YgcG